MQYPVTIEHDTNGTVLVSFVDFPAHSIGEDLDEALLNAEDALETAVINSISRRAPFPLPSKVKPGQKTVHAHAQVAVKILLSNEMIAKGIKKAELARRMHVKPPQIDRLLNPRHASGLETLETAFQVMGKNLQVSAI